MERLTHLADGLCSVIICTHDPRCDYLGRVLDALHKQSLSMEKWELLLVDNASREPLTPKLWDLSWHPNARHIREEKVGIASARLRGMQEANTNLIVFVDDDNVLASDYLSEAIRIEKEWPTLGVWGSSAIAAEFETEPAKHLQEYLHLLSLREVKNAQWSNVFPCHGALPWGAGQCLRGTVAAAYRDHFEKSSLKVTGQVGQGSRPGSFRLMNGADSFGGEDVEISFVACRIGFGVGIFPELRLTHLIPKERVQEDYLVNLAEGIGTASQVLAYKWEKILPRSPFFDPIEMSRAIKNVLVRRGIDRRMYVAGLRSRIRAKRIVLNTT